MNLSKWFFKTKKTITTTLGIVDIFTANNNNNNSNNNKPPEKQQEEEKDKLFEDIIGCADIRYYWLC
jgi:hypothetical protein